jgi:hypothetical protein
MKIEEPHLERRFKANPCSLCRCPARYVLITIISTHEGRFFKTRRLRRVTRPICALCIHAVKRLPLP